MTDASKYYLARRSLQSAADARGSGVGAVGVGRRPLLRRRRRGRSCASTATSARRSTDYGSANHLADRFDDLAMQAYADDSPGTCVAAGADHVTVVATSVGQLPLVNILGTIDKKFADGVQLTVVAHAALRCDTC